MIRALPCFLAAILLAGQSFAQRARDLGVPFEGSPGPLNAITDIAGVEVGHTTIVDGSVRTGVTVIWPRGKNSGDPAFGGWFSQNGNGEMTGTAWIEESGFVDGPIFITNTHSVGTVRDASIAWYVDHKRTPGTNTLAGGGFWSLPVVAETYDGFLNDTNGFHVKPEHVFRAMDGAQPGPVPEGNVGGGTGMICFGFKGGIGTSSRVAGRYRVAALVQCNCGAKRQLRIGGVPVGAELDKQTIASNAVKPPDDTGSIIIVIATDAPLVPHQMKRVARRATMGLARLGATSGNGSGDIFIAFSTANPQAAKPGNDPVGLLMLPNDAIGAIFEATVQATEEAITNALVAAKDMTGYAGHTVKALPHDQLQQLLKKYNRLSP